MEGREARRRCVLASHESYDLAPANFPGSQGVHRSLVAAFLAMRLLGANVRTGRVAGMGMSAGDGPNTDALLL